jgi:hypothetical protein
LLTNQKFECELTQATFTINTNAVSTVTNGKFQPTVLMESIANNSTYTGASTNKINQLSNGMNGYKYQVVLSKNGNTCGRTSNPVNLTVYSLPIKLTCNFSAV